MIIYASSITPRLRYVGNFICNLLIGEDAQFISDINEYKRQEGVKINYSHTNISADDFWIQPHTLLFEKNICPQKIEITDREGVKIFFQTQGDFPFDIFAGIFYLISRYEEYFPHQKDMYGRYAHESSVAFKEGFLNVPLVNIWVEQLKSIMLQKFPAFKPRSNNFSFLPTYDIDEAYSFKHKSWKRSIGGACKDLIKGNFKRFTQRKRVLNNKEEDPFDSYIWLNDLHRHYSLHPVYFFLVAAKNGKYDKHILPSEMAMQTLLQQTSTQNQVGIHPSWQSSENQKLLNEEKKVIENIIGFKITQSRQHFIRFELPTTYRYLIETNIQQDYSMGYGSINGFRASVATPFYWYDLEKEQITALQVFPFCFMDANSFYEQKQTAENTFEELMYYYNDVKKINGLFITIWHNTFLGTDEKFKGWREVYASFIKKIKT